MSEQGGGFAIPVTIEADQARNEIRNLVDLGRSSVQELLAAAAEGGSAESSEAAGVEFARTLDTLRTLRAELAETYSISVNDEGLKRLFTELEAIGRLSNQTFRELSLGGVGLRDALQIPKTTSIASVLDKPAFNRGVLLETQSLSAQRIANGVTGIGDALGPEQAKEAAAVRATTIEQLRQVLGLTTEEASVVTARIDKLRQSLSVEEEYRARSAEILPLIQAEVSARAERVALEKAATESALRNNAIYNVANASAAVDSRIRQANQKGLQAQFFDADPGRAAAIENEANAKVSGERYKLAVDESARAQRTETDAIEQSAAAVNAQHDALEQRLRIATTALGLDQEGLTIDENIIALKGEVLAAERQQATAEKESAVAAQERLGLLARASNVKTGQGVLVDPNAAPGVDRVALAKVSEQAQANAQASFFQRTYAGAKGLENPSDAPTLGSVFGGRALTGATYFATGYAIFGAINQIKQAFEESSKLSKEFALIQSQLDIFGQGSQMDHIKDQVLSLSTATATAADEVAKMERNLAGVFADQSGAPNYGKAQVEGESALKFAKVTGDSLGAVTDQFTAINVAFEDNKVAPTFEDIANTALNLQNQLGGSAAEIVKFTADIAPLGAELGFSAKQLEGLGAVAEQVSGRPASALSETLGRSLAGLQSKFPQLVDLLGANPQTSNLIAPLASAFGAGDIPQVLEILVSHYKDLNKAQLENLALIVGGRREAGTFYGLLARAPETLKALNEGFADPKNTLDDQFSRQAKTIGFAFDQAKIAFQNFAVALLDSGVTDALVNMAGGLSFVAKGASFLLDIFSALNGLTHGFVGQMIQFDLVVVAVYKSFGLLAGALRLAMAAQAAFTTTTKVATDAEIKEGAAADVAGTKLAFLKGGSGLVLAAAGAALLELGSKINEVSDQNEKAIAGETDRVNKAIAAGESFKQIRDEFQGTDEKASSPVGGIGDAVTLIGRKASPAFSIGPISVPGGDSAWNTIKDGFDNITGTNTFQEPSSNSVREDALRKYQQNTLNQFFPGTPEDLLGPIANVIGDPNDPKANKILDAILTQDDKTQKALGIFGANHSKRIRDQLAVFKDSLQKQADANDAIAAATDPNAQQGIDDLQASFDAGDTSAKAVNEALQTQIDNLDKAIPALVDQKGASDPDVAKLIKARADYRKKKVDNAIKQVQNDLQFGQKLDSALGGTGNTAVDLQNQLARINDAANSLESQGVLEPSQAQDLGLQIIEAQKKKRSDDASKALTAIDKDRILAAPISVDPEAQRLLVNTELSTGKFADYIDKLHKSLGLTADQVRVLVSTAFVSSGGSMEAVDTAISKMQSDVQKKQQDAELRTARTLQYEAFILSKMGFITKGAVERLMKQAQGMFDDVNRSKVADAAPSPSGGLDGLTLPDKIAPDPGAAEQLRKDLLEQEEAIANANIAVAKAQANGDPFRIAQLDAESAAVAGKYARLKGDVAGEIQAHAAAITAEFEMQKAQVDLDNANRTLDNVLHNNDPLEVAQNAVASAQEAISVANGPIERANALAQEITAQRSYAEAIRGLADAQTNVLIAMANAAGDTVGAAKLKLKELQDRFNNRQALGLNDTQIAALQAQIIDQTHAVAQTQIQEGESQIQTQLDLGKINKAQAIAELQALLVFAGNQKEVDQIQLEIKRLKDQLGQDYKYNLPSVLGLPTLYEARRLGQSSSQFGGAGYNDNRIITINVNAQTNADPNQIAAAVANVMGPPQTYGVSGRRY